MQMNNQKSITFFRYSPDKADKKVLKELFIAHDGIYDRILKELKTKSTDGLHRYFLIIGPRGIGKSHLITLLFYEISDTLSDTFIPIKLAEEEYSIYRASDLFIRILEEYNYHYKGSIDIQAIRSSGDEEKIVQSAVECIKTLSISQKKQIIIFLENLHQIFKQMDKTEIQKLRGIFQKHDPFSVIATSPALSDDVSDHNEPFYNFFTLKYLEELTLEEVEELIKRIAETDGNTEFIRDFTTYKPRIKTIFSLTGGSPRLVIFLYQIISTGKIDGIEDIFLRMMDEHTPYYQEIFGMLTGQKKIIFDTILRSKNPLTPNQISEITRIEVKTVTTQLKRLKDDGYLRSHPDGRNSYYEARERLFRLWREIRMPFGRNRISLFVEFISGWYTDEERKTIFLESYLNLESGRDVEIKSLCYFADVLQKEDKIALIPEFVSKLKTIGFEDEARKFQEELIQTGQEEIDLSNYEKALTIFEKCHELDPKNSRIFFYKGLSLLKLGKYEESLTAFDKGLEIEPDNGEIYNLKGLALGSLKRYEESLTAFDKGLEIEPNNILLILGKSHFLSLIDRYNESTDLLIGHISNTFSTDIYHLIIIQISGNYYELNKLDEAITWIKKISDIGSKFHIATSYLQICLLISKKELLSGNYGNGKEFIQRVIDNRDHVPKKELRTVIINFLKDLIKEKDISAIKIATETIVQSNMEIFEDFLKPLTYALRIIETNNRTLYYSDLQIEEREIVSDIVFKITGNKDLSVPQ